MAVADRLLPHRCLVDLLQWEGNFYEFGGGFDGVVGGVGCAGGGSV